jgi:hypothetical protein
LIVLLLLLEFPRTAIEMNWIPAFAGMTDEEKINRASGGEFS